MSSFLYIGKVIEPIYRSVPHSHTTWEISVYTHGRGTSYVGSEPIPFTPGTIICYPPRIPHYEDSPAGCREFYMHTDLLPAELIQTNDGRTQVLSDRRAKLFERLTGLLYEEFCFKEPGWEASTQRMWDQLVDYLLRWKQPRENTLVERLKFTLLKNVGNPRFRLGDAMETFPMSPDHLRTLFAASTGKTPGEYLTDLRINEARQLLRNGGLSIKEVSHHVGFVDPHYFSRVFRASTGQTPTDYAQTPAKQWNVDWTTETKNA
jgi:AraC-like DNA-binding protein